MNRKHGNKVFTGIASVDGAGKAIVIAASSQTAVAAALVEHGFYANQTGIARHWKITTDSRAVAAAMAAPLQPLMLAHGSYTPARGDGTPWPPKAHLPPVLRVAKSVAKKREIGRYNLNVWLSPEAAKALNKLTGENKERGAIPEVVNKALLLAAKRQG
jgi:hypothetical protein